MGADLYAVPEHEDRAVCAEPAACVVCVLSPLDGESRDAWMARLRGEVAAELAKEDEFCANGHPWTDETTRFQRDGVRYCLFCKRGAERRFRERHLEAVS